MGRFAEAADEVSKRLQDVETAHRERVKTWLNIAKDEFLVRNLTWDFLQETNTLSTVADQQEYDLSLLVPAGQTWKVTRVEYMWEPTTREPVFEASNRLFDELYGLSTEKRKPEMWTTWAGKLVFGPIPNKVFAYKIRFYRDIPDFVEGSIETPPWNQMWDETWYAYTEYIGLRFNDDERARERLSDFERGVQRMMGSDTPRSLSSLQFGDRRQRPVPFRFRNDYTIVT